MNAESTKRLTPYGTVPPGFEAIYTGEDPASVTRPDDNHYVDAEGRVVRKWSVWTWKDDPNLWDATIRCLNNLQERLGPLDDATRMIRAHIGSLVTCERAIPVSIDDLLAAIGRGAFIEPPLRNGCWGARWWTNRGTPLGQTGAMVVIEGVVRGYLAGEPMVAVTARFPHAARFIQRAYGWLGPRERLTEVQKLLLERAMLPFEFFTGRNPHYGSVNRKCFEPGGEGSELDRAVERLAGLPTIHMPFKREYRENLEKITDPEKKELYVICCHIAWGVHGLSDCHHATFRFVESWIHGIGAGRFRVESRNSGSERERLGRLLFGYALGLDTWLMGMPMQFLLLDLGHADLGFDPKNEVLRVFVYLGEARNPTKEWLVGCLWWTLLNNIGGPMGGPRVHKRILERAERAGLSVRKWMDSVLEQQQKG